MVERPGHKTDNISPRKNGLVVCELYRERERERVSKQYGGPYNLNVSHLWSDR